jgi:hypothetical protein
MKNTSLTSHHSSSKKNSLLAHIIKNKHIMIPKVWMLRGKPWRLMLSFSTKNAIEPQLV